MAKPTTEVIHYGKLQIRRNGEIFGSLWIEKGCVYWRIPKGKGYFKRTWSEFNDFMTKAGRFKD